MSKKIGKIVIIAEEPEMIFHLCGKISETRPYGPNGEEICYECGEKDKLCTWIQMNMRLYGTTRQEAIESFARANAEK